MTSKTWIRFTFCVATAFVLIACGGGGGSGGSSLPSLDEAATGSAALIVPPGQSSLKIDLTNCIQTTVAGGTTRTVSNANVVVDTAGNLAFSGAVGTATLAELLRIDLNESNMPVGDRVIYSAPTDPIAANIGYSVEYEADNKFIALDTFNATRFSANTSALRHVCKLSQGTASFVVQSSPSPSRIVNTVLTNISGTVAISNFAAVTYTFANNIVSWEKAATSTSVIGKYLSFNLRTGAIGSGQSLDSSTHTSLNYQALRANPGTRSAYEENFAGQQGKYIRLIFGHFNIEVNQRTDRSVEFSLL
jgi:hypothetical protein